MLITREEGFSLLEVIAAVAVLGIILVPACSMLAGGRNAVLLGKHQTEAATLAQDGMETLKGYGYEQLRSLMVGREELELEENLGFYSRKYKLQIIPLEAVAAVGDGEILFVQVMVSWSDVRGRRSVSLSSLLGRGLESCERFF